MGQNEIYELPFLFEDQVGDIYCHIFIKQWFELYEWNFNNLSTFGSFLSYVLKYILEYEHNST